MKMNNMIIEMDYENHIDDGLSHNQAIHKIAKEWEMSQEEINNLLNNSNNNNLVSFLQPNIVSLQCLRFLTLTICSFLASVLKARRCAKFAGIRCM